MTPLSRRAFLLSAVAAGSAIGAAPTALAVDSSDAFTTAAAEYAVPPGLLAAFSYSQTRWADHAGRPSRSLGYGPMHLIDGAGIEALRRAEGSSAQSVDTLGAAASLSGLSPDTLRTDPSANIRGAAALLADRQKAAGAAVGATTDPASWYDAVASSSGLSGPSAQISFADNVLATMRSGAKVKDGGTTYSLGPQKVGSPGAGRSKLVAKAKKAKAPSGPVDAPAGLDVEWLPAPYVQYGPDPSDYGNHDLAFRPDSPKLTHIVIHDTECSYDVALKLVQDPDYLAWNYTVRSSDGHIAQHLNPKDIGWHAGNWWMNMHAIGIEHEGFAPQGYTWFSEPMYRSSARLVRYLCREYNIPMDRGHIIGHDQVPGVTSANIRGMHWDPGPFWDWEHYFELMGAPLVKGSTGSPIAVGDVVRILPGFDSNVQPVTGCDGVCVEGIGHGTNFVPLHTQPSQSSPLVTDPGIKAGPSTTTVSDMGARAAAGTDYVVADIQGDWTAIWYLGDIAWFANPASARTARKVKGATVVSPKAATAKTYGRAYPEASAYPDPTWVQPISPLLYTIKSGQAYVVLDDSVPTDYYRAKTFSPDTPGDHVDVVGTTRYYEIDLGHRVAFVMADEVDIV